jgi:hypothetical protein
MCIRFGHPAKKNELVWGSSWEAAMTGVGASMGAHGELAGEGKEGERRDYCCSLFACCCCCSRQKKRSREEEEMEERVKKRKRKEKKRERKMKNMEITWKFSGRKIKDNLWSWKKLCFYKKGINLIIIK